VLYDLSPLAKDQLSITHIIVINGGHEDSFYIILVVNFKIFIYYTYYIYPKDDCIIYGH
jgi:hypothetical protein